LAPDANSGNFFNIWLLFKTVPSFPCFAAGAKAGRMAKNKAKIAGLGGSLSK
jgi:hypothetical protein